MPRFINYSIFTERLFKQSRRGLALVTFCLVISGAAITNNLRSRAHTSLPSSTAQTAEKTPSLQGEKAIEHLKEQGAYDSLAEAMAAIKYEAKWQSKPKLANNERSDSR